MGRDVEYYLRKSVEELKSIDLKKEILYNDNHYVFVWFCQSASEEQIRGLLDEEGISLLAGTDRLADKLNGLLTCGKELDLFESEKLCEMVIDNDAMLYTQDLNEKAALDLARYTYENNRRKMLSLYKCYNAENQVNILNNMEFEIDEKIRMLKQSRRQSAEHMLENYSIDLSELKIEDIEILAGKGVMIPFQGVTSKFVSKITNIGDVNRYRMLINRLEENNDVSQIENVRKKVYEEELDTIGEDGLLEKFRLLKEKIESRNVDFNDRGEIENIAGFVGSEEMVYKLMMSDNLDEDIKKMNDYYISNMIVDYFLEDVPTNALKNINSMLAYNAENSFLDEKDKRIYETFRDIDTFDAKHKIMLFKGLKEQNIDMVSKFYDDFSKAKETMVEQVNDNILTENNVGELYNEELSTRAGVPVYYLTGQKFKSLVRNIGVHKSNVLQEQNLDFRTDGSSFSLDGSELLQVFGDCSEYYTLAYSGIPPKQLIHAYPTDSFSKYTRTYEHDISENMNSTDRIMGLYTPEQFTTMPEEYNELIISVPNMRKRNELEEQLEKPKAFAIYCYDKICPNDIESAKTLGVGIIVVNTKCYSIDRSNRLSHRDTIDRQKYSYVKNYDRDERSER